LKFINITYNTRYH